MNRKFQLVEGGRDQLLQEGCDAVFRYAMTGDPSYLDKALVIDKRLSARGSLTPINTLPTGNGPNRSQSK